MKKSGGVGEMTEAGESADGYSRKSAIAPIASGQLTSTPSMDGSHRRLDVGGPRGGGRTVATRWRWRRATRGPASWARHSTWERWSSPRQAMLTAETNKLQGAQSGCRPQTSVAECVRSLQQRQQTVRGGRDRAASWRHNQSWPGGSVTRHARGKNVVHAGTGSFRWLLWIRTLVSDICTYPIPLA